jgi:SNF2 family DNA or RNA helicase
MVSRACAMLAVDPGLGKTGSSMAAFQLMLKKGLVERMLVVAPKRVAFDVWPRELEKWDDFHNLSMRVLHEDGDGFEALGSKHHISVVNVDGLETLFGYRKQSGSWAPGKVQEVFGKKWPWDMLVIDESTKFKHSDTHRFKTLKPFIEKFRRRYCLTGSPAPNGLMDLFGQVYILDYGQSLGGFITKYRNEYFDKVGFGGYDWVLREGAEEKIYKKLRPLVIRMDAADHLDLPPIHYNNIWLDLPDKARRTYDQMQEQLITEVDGELVTAANVATATGKCRQIANGGVFNEEKVAKRVHDAKTDALVDLVEELQGKPVFVGYEFRHDLERIKKALPKAPHIGGGVSTKEASKLIDQWNAGELPVLLAQPQSVAHGLNLQGVNAAVCWYGIPWDLEIYEQFNRRVWRQGQTGTVVVHHLAIRNSVDATVLKTLASKNRTQRALLDALKNDLSYATKSKDHRT